MTDKSVKSGDASADIQDPLPENSFSWRRFFSIGLMIPLLVLMWLITERLATTALVAPLVGIPALLSLAKWTIGFAGMVTTYYMIAPSAEHITRIVQSASLLKHGVVFKQSATVDEPAGTATSAAEVGKPVSPTSIPEIVPQEAPVGENQPLQPEPETPEIR